MSPPLVEIAGFASAVGADRWGFELLNTKSAATRELCVAVIAQARQARATLDGRLGQEIATWMWGSGDGEG